MFSPEEERTLLEIARNSIAHALAGAGRRSDGKRLKPQALEGRLAEPRGAFVTIRMGHDLRGCIGFIVSDRPLGEVVAEVAVKAALEDPRFPPMTMGELEAATLEISALTPLKEIGRIDDIEVGRDGLLIELGRFRGLLLPQVATEQGWNRGEFLDHTARKAGLPPDAWKDPEAKIFSFSAEIIQEHPPRTGSTR
jgi:AmmeMemoRadiSam system protein A